MRIVICTSMRFPKEIYSVRARLEEMGHQVLVPEPTETSDRSNESAHVAARRKIEGDLIRRHWTKIRKADAILVLNYDKDGIANNVGGNSFLEMGFAYVLRKRIFLLNPIPKMSYEAEMIAMQPMILYGDLGQLVERGSGASRAPDVL
jgi:hypothetical protein